MLIIHLLTFTIYHTFSLTPRDIFVHVGYETVRSRAPPSVRVSTINQWEGLFICNWGCVFTLCAAICAAPYKKKRLSGSCDTVNHYLNSDQSPNAFGIVRQTVAHGQMISGLNESLWMSHGGRVSSIVLYWCSLSAQNWCTSVMQLLKPPTIIWKKGLQWHLI